MYLLRPIRELYYMHPNYECYFTYGSDGFIARRHPIHESDRAIVLYILYSSL